MAEVTSIAPLLHEPGLIAYECPRCGCFGNSRNLSIRVASGLANGLACINQSCIQTSCVVAEVRASPNHNERKNGMMPDTIILHYTGTRDIEDRIRQLCTMGSEVLRRITWCCRTGTLSSSSRSGALGMPLCRPGREILISTRARLGSRSPIPGTSSLPCRHSANFFGAPSRSISRKGAIITG